MQRDSCCKLNLRNGVAVAQLNLCNGIAVAKLNLCNGIVVAPLFDVKIDGAAPLLDVKIDGAAPLFFVNPVFFAGASPKNVFFLLCIKRKSSTCATKWCDS